MGVVIPPPTLIRSVLETLADRGELSGSELVRRIPKLTRNTAYVMLRRLEEKRIVRSRKQNKGSTGKVPLRLYALTRLGFGLLILSETYDQIVAKAEDQDDK